MELTGSFRRLPLAVTRELGFPIKPDDTRLTSSKDPLRHRLDVR